MKSKSLNTIALSALAATLVAIYSYPYLPTKRITLIPGEVVQFLYADVDETEQNNVTWIDEENHHWRCFKHSPAPMQFCGYNLLLHTIPGQGTDLSAYQRLEMKVDYKGDVENLRVFLRHFDPRYSSAEDHNSAKFISADIRAAELSGEIIIDFDEFRVADWWLYQFHLPRHQAKAEFSNITALGIDFAEPITQGDHDLKIEKLEFVGLWIEEKDWYLGILGFWMLAIFAFVVRQWLILRRQTYMDRMRIHRLALKNENLQTRSEKYKHLSSMDTLTETYNRRGIEQAVQEMLSRRQDKSLALILLDIDRFKQLNDRFGHAAGDRILKQIAQILMGCTRSNDRVGRWGGEEFILLCPQTDLDSSFSLAEKVRHTIADTTFEADGHPVHITSSFGVGVIQPNESFITTFKRIDKALYNAKSKGRNCTVKAP